LLKKTKVFGVGFHKTGTKSLKKALEILGYKVTGPNDTKADYTEDGLEFERYLEIIEKYDAFQDNPWPLFYREIYTHFPHAKFILTVRDAEQWIKSVVDYFGQKQTPMRRYIYGAFAGSPVGNESHYLQRYLRHNDEVKTFFHGKENFLLMDITKGDGWESLCPFLGKEIPDTPFPYENGRRNVIPEQISHLKTFEQTES